MIGAILPLCRIVFGVLSLLCFGFWREQRCSKGSLSELVELFISKASDWELVLGSFVN